MKTILVALMLSMAAVQGADSSTPVTRYRDQDLIPIRTKLRFTTLIVLPPGEEISEVSCGDKEFWVVDGQENFLHVKPAKEGAVTNLNVVLKSKVVYSFVVEEIGSKGVPDLKVVIGPDEVLKLRAEQKALQQRVDNLNAAHQEELARMAQERARDAAMQKEALERVEMDLPVRLTNFLTKQKFNLVCFQKSTICLKAVFTTDTNTYIIGKLGTSPSFTGYDPKGDFHSGIKFERENDVYKLSVPINSGTIWYGPKEVTFSTK
jgi:hypothetical protein